MNKLTKITVCMLGFCLLAPQWLRAANCGNIDPWGVGGSCRQPDCPPDEETDDPSKRENDSQEAEGCDDTDGEEGVNQFRTFTANAFRPVTDLRLFGGVGEHRLTWKRHANSRYDETAGLFGQGQNWRHSYQWNIADAGTDGQGRALLEIHYPDGKNTTFTKVDATHWNPYLKVTDRITQNGATFTMQRANGWRYTFVRRDDGSYRMECFTDTMGNQYTFTYNANNQLVRITEPAGRYIEITYQDILCNDVEFITFATIGSTPPAGWSQINITDTTPYRYLRYVGPDGSYSTVAEIEFYDAATNKLSGTPFGASPAYGPGKEFDKASDGLTNTWYSYSQTTKGFTGIDLGSGNATRISKVRFFPLTGYASRMNGGWFQGSLQAPVIVSVIASVQGSDGRSVSYDYQTITDASVPGASYAVLTAAHYGDGTQATYTYAQTMGGTQPSLITASDPRYRGAGSRIKYEYVTTRGRGLISKERNLVTNNELVRLESVDDNNLKVTYANGTVRKFYQPTDKYGHVVKRTDGNGKDTNYTYGQGSGLMKSKTDAENHTTLYNYSIYGHLLSRTNADNSVESWTRDDLDLVLTHTDELGRVTTYTRDAQHRVTRIDYPDNSFETFDYNQWGQITTNRLRNGGPVINNYDASGLKTSTTDPEGNTTSYAYDEHDLLAGVRDARLNVTAFEYNERGQITKVINPDSTTRGLGYDQFGNKTAETNELGFVTSWAYDEFNRVTTNRNPLGYATIYAYGLPGGGGCGSCSVQDKPIRITLPSGKQIAMTYDLEWRKLSETLGYGTADAATTQWRYDTVGNVLTNIDARGKVWVSTYDERNRRKTSADPLSNTTQWGYDPVGNVTAVIRPDSGLTTNVYSSMNQVTWSRDPKLQVTQFAYDAAGNMTSLTDANNHVYQFGYDLLNRRRSMTYPGNGSDHEDHTYDEVGNLHTYRNRAGNTRTYQYDTRNRETDATWDDGVTPATHREYDAASRLLVLNNANAQLSYTYDNANQLLAESSVVGPQSSVISYTYDADGNRLSLTYPDGTVVTNAYTARNQLASVSSASSVVASYQYDLNGNRIAKTLGNNTTVSYAFDAASRLTNLVGRLPSGGVLYQFDYALNSVGNRTNKTQSGTGVSPVYSESYTYDAIDQITGVAYATNSIPMRNVAYQYDSVGNRQQVTEDGNTTGYTANNLNQYTVVDGSSLSYDNNGNLSSTMIGLLGSWTYTYDAQNRLVSAFGGPSSVTATFAYDARNRCVARTINGVTTYLAYDGWSLLEERNANGGLLAEYIHGATIDEILQRTTGSGAVYYHHDGLGNTIAVTDNTGALAESYTYDVFGTPSFFDANGVGLPSSVVGNRFLFTGREFLAETGLYDYRNRFYSPVLGRFLQTDPIRFEAKDVNLYRYVWNKPAEWLDPSGLFVSANPRDAQTVEQSVGVEAAKAMGAINDFSDTYADMRKANWKLSDKYFHCLANCKAAKRGETGRRVAEAISEIRELSDEYLKGDSRSECDTDREANDHGREAGRKGQNCKTACNKYRPRGLPSQY